MISPIKKILKDETGSIMPFISILLIIFILIGAYQISTTFVYRDRTVIRDALDSAVTSGLAAGVTKESKSTSYSEYHVVETDDKGNVIADYWVPTESASRYYIYIDKSKAESVAKEYFNKIISKNNVKASLISWDFSVQYDDERYLGVYNDRSHTSDPAMWWKTEFGDSQPEGWNNKVRYPRWVKVSATAKVSVPAPMGIILGKSNLQFSWHSEGIKELNEGDVFN